MNNIKSLLLLIAALLLAFAAGGIVGRRSAARKGEGTVSIGRDTVYRTIYKVRPQELSHGFMDTRFLLLEVAAADTVRVTDTTYIFSLPVEQTEYGDENYHAWVSGVHPELDSIRLTFPTVYEYEKVVSKPRWSLGVQGGMGVTVEGGVIRPVPYIGVGVSYNLLSW